MQNSRRVFILGQIFVLCIAFCIRLINLTGSFWLDEAAQAVESARPLAQQFDIIPDFQPPFFHLLVHTVMQGGTSEWWLRLSSLIPGLITIWLTMLIGKKLMGIHVGLTAGILLATSQFHTFYSQELRPYSLAAMFGLLVMYCYFHWLDGRRFSDIGLVIFSILGLYTMYLFPLLLLSLLVSTLLFHRSKTKQLVWLLLISLLAFLPWLPTFLKQLNVGTTLAATTPAWSQVVSPPIYKMVPLVFAKFMIGRITIDANLRDIAIVAFMSIMVVFILSRSLTKKHTKEIALWFMLPIIFAFFISLKVPVLDPKRVLYCLPALSILLAAGIGKGVRSAVVLSVLLALNMFNLSRYASEVSQQREPWRQAIYDVEQVATKDDSVIFAFPEAFAPWLWYQTAELPTTMNSASNRVFVFEYLMDVTDPHRSIEAGLQQKGFQEIGFVQYPGIGKIKAFQREY